MEQLQIESIEAADLALLSATIERCFGGEPIVSPTRLFHLDGLPGIKAIRQGETVGFLCYDLADGTCEIVVLVSLVEGKGVGSALIAAVQAKAEDHRCNRLLAFTTNDNVGALMFYQRRGFEIATVHRNAMAKAREIKPDLPIVGANGIPLRDMIELEKPLDPYVTEAVKRAHTA